MVAAVTLNFLSELEKNNNKPWFDAHKADYEKARENFLELIEWLLANIGTDSIFLKEQKAKDCMFRLFRDVRFSKDKTPYKTHFGAFLSRGGRKFEGAGFYLHLSPNGKTFAGGGLWHPGPALLKEVRQEIDYGFDEFQAIINNKDFKKYFRSIEGESLKKLPKGYEEDNPAISFLKMKSFTAGHSFSDAEVLDRNFPSECIKIFSALDALVKFLNRPLD